MYSFQYRKAKTLQEAADWLVKDEDAKALSGGMTLLPTLKARLAQPSQLIDVPFMCAWFCGQCLC